MRITSLAGAETLLKKLLDFCVKVDLAGRDSCDAWREGIHDDLVLATALTCWYAERDAPLVTYIIYNRRLRLETASLPLREIEPLTEPSYVVKLRHK